MSQKKNRLDKQLVENKIFNSRESAKSAIMAGKVFVDGIMTDKAGTRVGLDQIIEVKGSEIPYVSRGGIKLEKGLEYFDIDVKDKVVIDVGASTGGFTHCLLKYRVKKVFAVDVGYGQFAWTLRNDPKVVCMERTNIRYVTEEDIGELCDLSVIDVSFISLRLVMPVVKNLIKDQGEIIALVKPQFEAGREKVGKKGVVKDPETHMEVLRQIMGFSRSIDLYTRGLCYSPIIGPKGNIEFLLHVTKSVLETEINMEFLVRNTVSQAHNELL